MSELKAVIDKELKGVTFSADRKRLVLDGAEPDGNVSGAEGKVPAIRDGSGEHFHMTGKVNGRRRMLKVAAILLMAGVVVPSSVYAAQKLYRMQLERENYRTDVVIKKNGGAEENKDGPALAVSEGGTEKAGVQESMQDSTEEAGYYKPVYSYLPEGAETFPGGGPDMFDNPKLAEETGEDYILRPELLRLDTEDTVTWSVPYSVSSEQIEVNGHSAYIVHKDDSFEMNEVGILFEEERCLLNFWVGKGYSDEEIIKVLEGVSLVPDPEREYTLSADYSERVSREQEVDDDVRWASVPDTCYQIGDTLPGNAIAPHCAFTVDAVEYYEDVAGFDTAKFYTDTVWQFEEDGAIRPWIREIWNWGDGVNTKNELVRREEVRLTFVLVTATVQNNGTEMIEWDASEPIDFFDEAEDGTFEKKETETYRDEAVYLDGAVLPNDDPDYFFIQVEAGESVTYKVGYLVEEDLLDSLFWKHYVDMSSYGMTDTRYELVDLRKE